MILADISDRRAEPIRHMQERFSKADPEAVTQMLAVLVMLAGVFGLVYVLLRIQRRKSRPRQAQPMSLYLRTQRKLGLSLADCWWLWRLAATLRIAHPTALLISFRMFDEAVQEYCRGHGWLGDRTMAAPRFSAIRQRLFGATQLSSG